MIDLQHMSQAELGALVVAAELAQELRRLNIPAEHGRSWDGYSDHRCGGRVTWYLSPRACGGVLVASEDHGDTIFVDAGDLVAVEERLRRHAPLSDDPEEARAAVWAIFAPRTAV